MDNDPTPAGGLEPLLTVTELADYLGVPVATIYDWRVDRTGPRAIRIGRHLKFAVSDVRSWLETQREPEASKPADGW
ncbi:MAG: helix-turn-helix domain-containing protein [Propionibacteriales bacterium]|nr:helix-turn-helix domain-containing protein [Propionibacteriales bacterium]